MSPPTETNPNAGAGTSTESTAQTTSIERELTIAASPETVWQFLIDPDKATRWMGLIATFDAKPGGVYRVEVLPGQVARGEFVELDPPRRLVHTWGWESADSAVPPGSSTIEIDLIPNGEGTTVRFCHRDLPDAGKTRDHAHGWEHYLGRLVTAAAGGEPGADPWLSRRGTP
jgi:uncharacterized protein YndB with AHSA1/START domain